MRAEKENLLLNGLLEAQQHCEGNNSHGNPDRNTGDADPGNCCRKRPCFVVTDAFGDEGGELQGESVG